MTGDQDLFRELGEQNGTEKAPSSKAGIGDSAEKKRKIRIDDLESSVVEDLEEDQAEPPADEEIKEAEEFIEQMEEEINTGIANVLEAMGQKKYDQALEMIESLIAAEEPYMVFDGDSQIYRCFNENFEQFLYCRLFQPVCEVYLFQQPRPVCPLDLKYHTLYFLHGNILFELNRLEEAREALLKGLRWNPVDFGLMSEYTETFKSTGDLETFYRLTLEMGKIAFHPNDLARYYRNLGFYFIEKELYQEAQVCYELCLRQEPESETAFHELAYICQKTGKEPEPLTQEEIEEVCKRCNIPERGDERLLRLAYDNGRYCLQMKEYEHAKYLLGILYGLTHAPDIKEMLDSIPNEEGVAGEAEDDSR